MSSYLNEYENEKGRILGVTMANIVSIKPKNGEDKKAKIKIEPILKNGNYEVYASTPIPKYYNWDKNRYTIRRKSKSGNSTQYVFGVAANVSHSIGFNGSLKYIDENRFPIENINRLTDNDLHSLMAIAVKRRIKVRTGTDRDTLESLLFELLCAYCLTFRSKCHCK